MRVLFVGEGTVTDNVRCKLPAMHLAKLGYETAYLELRFREESPAPDTSFDAIIFSRPHHDSLMLSYKRLGIPVIVDMDDDFHAIPEDHPGYKWVGKGDELYLNKLENCLYLADRVTVATSALQERLMRFNPNCTMIPNGWSADNFNWLVKRSLYKDRFIFGWGGTVTHRKDFRQCINPIKAFLKKHTNAMISIIGDLEIYNYFVNVPEDQKLFIPMIDYHLYPIGLSMWDVLLAPLEDTYFNQAKSDIKLIDAGAKGIPYIASDISIYKGWEGCGLLVNPEGWYEAMEKLIEQPELCKEMGKKGQMAVKYREMTVLVEKWKMVIEEYAHAKPQETESGSPDTNGGDGVPLPLENPYQDRSNRLPNRRKEGRNKAARQSKKGKAKTK